MGLSWQQGPLSPRAIGRFVVPEPLPKRLLYAEPLRRRVRAVRVDGRTLDLESGQTVIPDGPDHDLYVAEAIGKQP